MHTKKRHTKYQILRLFFTWVQLAHPVHTTAVGIHICYMSNLWCWKWLLQHEIVKMVTIILWSSRMTGCVALWTNLGHRMKVAASSKMTDACLSDYTPSDLT